MSEVPANFIPLPLSLCRWRRPKRSESYFKGSSGKEKAPKAERTQNAPFPSVKSLNEF